MKKKDLGNCVEFYPYRGETFYHITLYKPRLVFGKREKATVNWGCHGSETPKRAELYGKALMAAAEMARKLNRA